MTEQLLQFIWQFRYFNLNELQLESGELLKIDSAGQLNTNQGPDFTGASIRIGETVWVGNIEVHLLASGWNKHAHQEDRNYNNVILHVVWENDLGERGLPLGGRIGLQRSIPVLVLQNRVPKLLLGRYEEWMNSRRFVACDFCIRWMETCGYPGRKGW